MRFRLIFLSLITLVSGFSTELFDTLQHDSFYANSAYCLDRYIFPSLFQKGKDYLEHEGLVMAGVFTPTFINLALSGDAFIAVNTTSKQIIVSFRGTSDIADWIVDVDFAQNSYSPLSASASCDGTCKVHKGAYEAFKKVFTKIVGTLKNTAKSYSDYEIIVTGHSLGGGYALLMGIELQLLGYKPSVITYGGLRMGNDDFNKWVNNLFAVESSSAKVGAGEYVTNTFIRVVQQHDIVPYLPPGNDYGHAGIQFQIDQADSYTVTQNQVEYDSSDYSTPSLTDSNYLQSGKILKLKISDHLKYFRRMGKPCYADSVTV